jgi:hypothetical protein
MTNRTIIIFGPFCSGTNLIEKIFANEHNVVKNDIIYWKHIIYLEQLIKFCEKKEYIIIFMYRNIYSWLNSINISKYNLSFENFESKAIFLKYKNYNEHKEYNNIIDIYDTYYKNYIYLLNKYDNTIFINYEKIIKENSFEYINSKMEKFGIELSNREKFNKTINTPSKNHGHCVKNVNEAIIKYEQDVKNTFDIIKNTENININMDIINYFEK